MMFLQSSAFQFHTLYIKRRKPCQPINYKLNRWWTIHAAGSTGSSSNGTTPLSRNFSKQGAARTAARSAPFYGSRAMPRRQSPQKNFTVLQHIGRDDGVGNGEQGNPCLLYTSFCFCSRSSTASAWHWNRVRNHWDSSLRVQTPSPGSTV